MRVFRQMARLAAIATLLGGTATFIAATSLPAFASSTAPSATQEGWVRIAHLSAEAPAMDIYMYPFGNPGHPVVLSDVTYGDVSAYMAVSPGQYTVAMRGFGAPATSHPALITNFMVAAQTTYTVAALGPDPGLRVEILQNQMATHAGKALVRVVQASLKENRVTVSYGPTVLARELIFGSATPYVTVSPGEQTIQLSAPGEHTTMSVALTADSVHTIVVLDGPSGLKADDLTDAAGSQKMPVGGASTGFGGTAPHPPASAAPWLLIIAAGALLTAAGFAGLRRPRRTAAVLH